MVSLTLPKHFDFQVVLQNHEPKDNTIKYLYMEYITSLNNLETKKIPNNKSTKIVNIKRVKSAMFGSKKNESINVMSDIEDIIKSEQQLEKIKELSKKFNLFCSFFLHILCPRCFNTNSDVSERTTKIHNCGYTNIIMKTVDNNNYENLFDGLIKCFVAYLMHPNSKDFNDEKKINKLTEWFIDILLSSKNSSLENKFYDKANKIHNYMIDKSDDVEFSEVTLSIKSSTIEYITIFYTHLYPCLKYFHFNRTDVFIRHGLEKNTFNYNKNTTFPPNSENYGWRINKVNTSINNYTTPTTPAYPIEGDKYPFNMCSIHSSNEIYGNIKGYIANSSFKKEGGKIHCRYDKSNLQLARDHLFAESSIPIEKWFFTYNIKSPEHLKRDIKLAIRSMLIMEIPFIADENLKNFSKVYEIIENKFMLLI
jgi:hypothetical protein